MKPVTDPSLIAQLEGGMPDVPAPVRATGLKPVTDSSMIAALEAPMRGPAADSVVQLGQGLQQGFYSLPGAVLGDIPNLVIQGVGKFADALNHGAMRLATGIPRMVGADDTANAIENSSLGQKLLANVQMPQIPLSGTDTVNAFKAGNRAMLATPEAQTRFDANEANSAPQTTAGRYVRAGAEMIPGGPMGKVPAAISAVSGMAGEGAKDLGGGPLSQLAAQFMTALTGHGLVGVKDAATNTAKSLFTPEGQERRAATQYQETARAGLPADSVTGQRVSPADAGRIAADAIDETKAKVGSLPVTTGQATDNPALLADERARSMRPANPDIPNAKGNADFIDLKDRQNADVSATVGKLAPAPGGVPTEANKFVESQAAAKIAERQGAVDEAQSIAEQGATEVRSRRDAAQMQRDSAVTAAEQQRAEQLAAAQSRVQAAEAATIPSPGTMSKPDTGAALRGVLTAEDGPVAKVTADKNALYDTAKAEVGANPVELTNTQEGINRLRAGLPYGVAEPPIVKNLEELGAKGPTNVLEMQKQSDLLGEEIARQKGRDGSPSLARQLTILKQGIDKDIEVGIGGNGAWRAADTFNRETFSPQVRQGATADVLAAGRGGAPRIPESETVARYAGGTTEDIRQLKTLIGDSPEGAKAVRDWLVNDLADKTVGGATPVAVRRWQNQNKELLAAFPDIGAEVKRTADGIESAARSAAQTETQTSKNVAATKLAENEKLLGAQNKASSVEDMFNKNVDEARAAKGATEAEINASAARLFIGKDPAKTVRAIMSGDNPAKDMSEALALVKQDPSGKALAGFKQTLYEAIEEKVTGVGRNIDTEARDVLRSKIENLTKDPATKRMLQALYADDPKSLEVLRQAQDKLQVMARSAKRASTGSDSVEKAVAALEQGQKDAVTTAFGFRAGRLTDLAQRVAAFAVRGSNVDVAAQVNNYLTRAALDPEYAKSLLLMDTAPKRAERMIKEQMLALGVKGVSQNTAP